MKTRVLSAILTLALLLSLAPAAVIPALPASAEAKATSAGVETVVFSEDFSSNPFDRGWDESDIDGDGNGWEYYDGDSVLFRHSGSGSLISRSYKDGAALTPNNLLTTISIAIPSEGKTTLKFWARGTAADAYAEGIKVNYHMWSTFASGSFSGAEFVTVNGWREYTVDISGEANGKLRGEYIDIYFYHRDCTGQNILALDDISIVNVVGPEYDLTIAGVTVTESNKNDVLGDGAFTYSPATKTLTVRGDCDCRSMETDAIKSYIDGLTIYVANDATIKSGKNENDCAVKAYAPLTITGPGLLKLVGKYAGLHGGGYNTKRGTSLTIYKGRVEVSSERFGVVYFSSFTLDDCYLYVKAWSAVYRCYNLETNYCKRVKGHYYDNVTGTILQEDYYHDAEEVLITVEYMVWVCGSYVTRENMNDILGNGAASYDPEANVLTIKGNMSYDVGVIINSIENLTIYVAKDAELSCNSNNNVIEIYKDTTITGPGLLKLRGRRGIYFVNPRYLTLDNARVDSRSEYGISADTTSFANIIMKNSYLHAVTTGGNKYEKCAFNYLYFRFEGCEIMSPEGAEIKNHGVYLNDECVKEVTIDGYYDLWLAGTQVTARQAGNMCGGAFTYNPSEKILYVKKDCETSGNESVIASSIPGLTVCVENNVTLTSDDCVIWVREDMTITGSRKLKLIARGSVSMGVYVIREATLTIKGAELDIAASEGIEGTNSEYLVIDSSSVKISASGYAAILNFKGLTLNKCEFVTPSEACFAYNSVFTNSNCTAYAKDVTIEPLKYNVWVSGTRINSRNASDVFRDGTVYFYDKGEYVPTELDLEYGFEENWFRYTRVLVLDNYKAKDMYYHEDGNCSAQLYIDDDIFVVLKGENTFTNGTYWNYYYDNDACHGVYIGWEDTVHFVGDGSLETYARWCDWDGLYAESASIYFCEEVEVTLKGKYGLHQVFRSDIPYVTVEDNAKLTCVGLGTDNADYPALDCAGVEIYNHGELLCETYGWGEAMWTWGSGYAEFSNDYYDILILKLGEFASGSNWNGEYTEPYKPEKGINVKGGGGVGGTDCHYIRIKGKTVLATSAWFNYSTYNVTPEKNDITVIFGLGPAGAAEIDYSGVVWKCSDNSVIRVTPTGSNRAVVTGFANGTATITITAKGGATASCTVVASGFGSSQIMKGDLDKDGEISVGDALIALRIAAKLTASTDEYVLIGDVDGDDEISVGDALKILRVAAKLDNQSTLG